MLVPQRDLNGMNWHTAQYRKGAEKNIRRLEAEEERAAKSMSFSAYVRSLDMVISFK